MLGVAQFYGKDRSLYMCFKMSISPDFVQGPVLDVLG